MHIIQEYGENTGREDKERTSSGRLIERRNDDIDEWRIKTEMKDANLATGSGPGMFMLGLERCTGRYESTLAKARHMWEMGKAEFPNLGEMPEVEVVLGVDAKDPKWQTQTGYDAQKHCSNRRGFAPMTPGELCCAEGHKRMLSRFLKTTLRDAIFMEDDVVFKRPPQALITMWQTKPVDCGILLPYDDGISEQVCMKRNANWKRMRVASYGAICYICTRDAAARLLKELTPTTVPADWPLKFRAEYLNLWQLETPMIAYNKDLGSEIQG